MLSLLATSSSPWKRPIDQSFHRINSPERFPGRKRLIDPSFHRINSPERFPGRFSWPISMSSSVSKKTGSLSLPLCGFTSADRFPSRFSSQIPHFSPVSEKTAPLPLPAGDYEVFINFRGSDVRYTFVDALYAFLDGRGIRTFYDVERLPKGEDYEPNLFKAIEESKIYIPILSPGYADSETALPLRELAHMVKCCEKEKGHIILPIFHMVSTEDVKNQTGKFGESFRKLVEGEEVSAETEAEWKEALRKITNLQGWPVYQSTRQGKIHEQIFSKVNSILMENYKLVTSPLVGIDPHVEKVKELLIKGMKILGIHGMSGIGKTEIAKAVCDNVSGNFDGWCFVEDVQEILSGKNGVVTLQNRILSDILHDNTKVRNASQGLQVIKDRICRLSSVLIILDNVAQGFEFEKTLGDLKDFSSDSRFIVTTNNARVMDFFQEKELYQVEEMHDDLALKLFSIHAFRNDHPHPEFISLSNDFVKVAAGLPLVLETIGALLLDRDKSFWVALLEQMRDIPADEVEKKLKITLTELTDNEEHIFLDIACYFTGEDYDRPSYLWSDSNLHPVVAIDNLRRRSLIKINERNEFWMHDQYKLLGRSIAREKNKKPWNCSRIWSNEDAVKMLRHKEGTPKMEILKVDMGDEDFELTGEEFKKLSGLKYVEVRNGRLGGHFKDILPHLRWLGLYNCRSIPAGLSLKELVILDLCLCPITDDWEGWNKIQVASNLKVVDVLSCPKLSSPPDLSQCRSLEHLNLESCSGMEGELYVGNFENLKVLNVGFSKIVKLTGDIRVLQNLQIFKASLSDLTEVPADIGELSSLTYLALDGAWWLPTELPVLPRCLKVLSVSSPRVPNLSELVDLEQLSFFICDGLEIQADIWKLSKLKTLRLLNCSCDNFPPALPSSLTALEIRGGYTSHLEVLPDLSNLNILTELVLGMVGVQEIVGLGELSMLKTLTITEAPNLLHLNGLEQLVLLKTLRVESCDVLGTQPPGGLIPEIPGLYRIGESSLSTLDIRCCPIIASILRSLSTFAKLKQLFLKFPRRGIDSYLSPELVLDVSGLHDIEVLSIIWCKQLTEVNGLERLESLRSLSLMNCKSLKKLSDPLCLKNLKELNVYGCTELESPGVEKLKEFRDLNPSADQWFVENL